MCCSVVIGCDLLLCCCVVVRWALMWFVIVCVWGLVFWCVCAVCDGFGCCAVFVFLSVHRSVLSWHRLWHDVLV